jgi:site-specific recombinase XerD
MSPEGEEIVNSWPELTEAYLTFMRTTGRKITTVNATRRYIERFQDFCAEQGALRPADVTTEHAAVFEQRLKWEPGDRGHLYSPSTVQNTLLLLRLFFRWVVAERLLLTNPFRDTRLERVKHFARRRYLTVDETQALLAAPPTYTLPGIRDHAILETLYLGGLRRQECVALDIADVDFETQSLRVRLGKGGIDRRQPMSPALEATLKHYLSRCRPYLMHKKKDDGALFVQISGNRMPGHGICNMVRKYATQAGLGAVTAHHLRHAFATHMLQNGARLEEVQMLLGHERIGTTSMYTGVMPLDVVKEHSNTHPRARKKRRKSASNRRPKTNDGA